ncbi:MAG TPA: protease modulator HflC [Caldilineaceae bacterium]|nr:protease modulator HflC [Caldilineaceae bacterium]
MRFLRNFLIGILLIALIAVSLMFYQVDTTEYAIVTQFGQPVRSDMEPGLYFKLPDPIQSVLRLDRRTQIYNLVQTEFLTKDKKNILAEAYTTWQVADPLRFYASVRTPIGADTRLADIVVSELGATMAQYDLTNLVTTEPATMQMDKMMNQVTEQVNQRTITYGFTVTDVRLKMLNFPEANRQSVFQRMKAERERIARQLRSEGTEEATKVRAIADAERTTILSAAQRDAERVRGEGEAEAIRIYAEAFGQDPEFYQFLRTLQAYDLVINDGTTLVLPADSELLKYLNQNGNDIQQTAITTEPTAASTTASSPTGDDQQTTKP